MGSYCRRPFCPIVAVLLVGSAADTSGTAFSGAGEQHNRSARSLCPNGLLCNHCRQGQCASLRVPLSRQKQCATI